ncbi:MAG: hypothetical protein JXB88_09115 [Spirochaetales bacterium]|nr:hypothetical protein [Spirochaetales bacterium]
MLPIIAECLLGRSNDAYDYYRTILPVKRNDRADIVKTEPYIYCQTISSNNSLTPGVGANSWLTGTASWMYVAFTRYILGIKPTPDGLQIKPCIPEKWDGFKAERLFRGCRYLIQCKRTGRFCLKIDGKEFTEPVIPPSSESIYHVDIEI